MNKISFFDNIHYSQSPIKNISEDYFFIPGLSGAFGYKEYKVVDSRNAKLYLEELPKQEEEFTNKKLVVTLLKIISYITVVVPFFVFIFKEYFRFSNEFEVVDNEVGTKDKRESDSDVENEQLDNVPESESPQTILPLSKTQGIVNGGNTCYLASCLQCVKNIPAFWRYLDDSQNPLVKKAQESDKMFEVREHIREQTRNILKKSLDGILVTGSEINKLREALHHFKPTVIDATQGNEVLEAWLVLAEALQIPIPSYLSVNSQGSFIAQWDLEAIAVAINTSLTSIFDNIEFETLSDILPVHLNRMPHSNSLIPVEFPMNLHLKCKGEIINFQLVGLTNASPGHSWAYLRDAQNNNWIKFNDSSVTVNAKIDENVKERLRTLFYERC